SVAITRPMTSTSSSMLKRTRAYPAAAIYTAPATRPAMRTGKPGAAFTTSSASSTKHAAATSAMNISSTRPPIQIAAPATASITTAEAVRTPRSEVFTFTGTSTELSSAKAPLPFREACQRLFQVGDGEIGPQHIGEPQFGIGRLPQQEIRQANFAAGPDQQVKRRQVRRVEVRGDRFRRHFAL